MNGEILKSYAKEFRREAYQPELRRSLFHFGKFLAFVGVFLSLQIFLAQVEIGGVLYVAAAFTVCFFQGLTYVGLWMIGHDCGHNSFSDRQTLNHWVGCISTAFMLMNYENFRRSHHLHHKFIGNIERDEAFGPKAKRRDFSRQKLVRSVMLLPFLAYLLGILFPQLTKTPGYFNYFWPDGTVRSVHAFLFVSTHIALLVLSAFWQPWLLLLFAGVLPIVVAWSFFLITTFLNHTGENTEWYPNEIWEHEKGVFNTVNLSYGRIIDYFIIGLGRDHFAHHVNPAIPHYKLGSATEFIGASHPNNRIVKGSLLRFLSYYYHYCLQRIRKGYFVDSKRPFRYEEKQFEREG